MELDVFPDGSCAGSPGVGGWAAVVVSKQQLFISSGRAPVTHAHLMEMRAMYEGLRMVELYLKELDTNATRISVYSDSKHLVTIVKDERRGATYIPPHGGKKLWRKLMRIVVRLNPRVEWIKRDINQFNKLADFYARRETSTAKFLKEAEMEGLIEVPNRQINFGFGC